MTENHPELLSKIIDRSPAVAFIWKLEDDWPILYVSDNVSQFGYSAEDLRAGKVLYRDIVHPEDSKRVASEIANFMREGVSEFVQQYRIITASGISRWVRDWTYIDQIDGFKSAQGIILDVTDEIDLKDRVFRIADSVPGAIFHHQFFPDGSDGGDFMSSGCQEIWELSAEEIIANPSLPKAMVVAEDLPGLEAAIQYSISNLSPFQHEWRIVTPSGKRKWLRGHGNPIIESDGIIGSMSVVMDITTSKNSEEMIVSGLRKTIHALASVIEARDPYTAGHEEKVSRIATLLGRELGLSENTLTGLQLAATVHDIGKISIPAEILSKPSKLTPVEFELVKGHSRTGADLLRPIEFPWPIADIVEQHHERCDGTGYPYGLECSEILYEARILAVADTLEAMANHRPYRPGLGMEIAMETIISGAGVVFDESVVEACKKLYQRGDLDLFR